MIACELLDLPEFPGVTTDIRKGRYLMPDFGLTNRYAVGVYILAPWKKLREDHSDEEIVNECVEFLAQPPARKKYAKKEPVAQYGDLQVVNPIWNKFLIKDGKQVISCVLSVKQRKNNNFWGEGISHYSERSDQHDEQPAQEGKEKVVKQPKLTKNGKRRGRPPGSKNRK